MPGVLIINHRLQDLLINPVFGAYLAVGTLISLLMGKYTLYDEVSLIFSLFCLTVHLSKCTRGLLHKPPVFEICLALRARISTQYVRCFLSGVSLETLVHRPGNFLHSRKFLCFFPSFLGSLHFLSGHFLTLGFP